MARFLTLLTIALVMIAFIVNAQPTIKKVPISSTNAASGEEMYTAYCAACHGRDGKGGGPAAPALKKAPADLTALTAHNGGAFPDRRVADFIRGDLNEPAHGSREMPVWGSLFSSLNGGNNTAMIVQLRVSNLTDYIKALQAK